MIFFVLDSVDTVLRGGVIEPGYAALSSFVAGPLRSGMILLIMVHGFNLMKGHTQGLSMVDVGWLVLKMAVVSELLINWEFFNDWIYTTVWDTYSGLAAVLTKPLLAVPGSGGFLERAESIFPFSVTNSGGVEVFQFSGDKLDEAFGNQLDAAYEQMVAEPSFLLLETDVFKIPFPGIDFGIGSFSGFDIPIPIPFPNIIGNIAGLIKFVMTIVLFASVFVVMLLSRLGLTSCLAVAPIFIALAMFQHTRSYTDAWFRGMLGFILTPMLLVLVLLVGDACIDVFDRDIDSEITEHVPSPVRLIAPAIAYLLLYYALAKSVASIPQFASGLVGSMLSHLGDGAAHSVIGGIHKGVDAGIGAAKGAAKGFATGGPVGAKMGAAQGAASALSR